MDKIRETKEEKVREAEMLKESNEQNQLEIEQLEKLRRQRVRDLKETYDRTLENRYKLKEAEAIMDEEENDEIRVYAAAKKKMAIMRNEREKETLKYKKSCHWLGEIKIVFY
jgi:hypothetical protein